MTAIQWYAVRTKPTTNPNRTTVLNGAKKEQFVDRGGIMRSRIVKGTGQREFVVETILRRRGFVVFLPTKRKWRYPNGSIRRKRLVKYALTPGWVFVGWPVGRPRWHDLFSVNLVHQVASVDGAPYQIPQWIMDDLFERWDKRKMRAPDRERFMRTHHEFNVGDSARVVVGPFDGQVVKVTDLRGAKAAVLLEFLGGERIIEVETEQLEVA